jgi:hypothetical protein
MITVFAALGAKALYLCFLWLGSAIAAQYLSERKGYGEKPGLVTGLLLSVLAVIIWLAWPARKDSRWKLQGAFGKGDGRTVAQMRADSTETEESA